VAQADVGPWFRLAVALLKPPLVLLTRQDWRGAEHLPPAGPDGGVVVASNHVSHLDPFTLAHFLWDNGRAVRYLAKDSVFRIPVLGRIVAGCGQIPVQRETTLAAGALPAAVEAVRRGECVGIYPEGTLTRDPGLWPMRGKTGAARVALETGCPVVPVAQWGIHELLPPYAHRPALRARTTVHVVAGPPVDLESLRRVPLSAGVLLEATARIVAAITGLLEELRSETAPPVRFDPRGTGLPPTGDWHRRRTAS
jgi:1-acyl-sn-glycerol-3-phosphate acyltransferase